MPKQRRVELISNLPPVRQEAIEDRREALIVAGFNQIIPGARLNPPGERRVDHFNSEILLSQVLPLQAEPIQFCNIGVELLLQRRLRHGLGRDRFRLGDAALD